MSRAWPSPSEYNTAVQNPGNCFRDPELQRGQVQTNKLGLPLCASGNFAVVYQLQSGAKRVAIRCFTRPITDQQRRYDAIQGHLKANRLSSFVDFAYLPDGILVKGQWHPLVRMEWISGMQLHRYVEAHLQNKQALSSLATQWRNIMEELRNARMAHGDLQHGNVLVDGKDKIWLVDYDGMFVPALRGTPPGEVGHPNYQHPERDPKGYYEENVDNFAALVIYLSLLAVKAAPSLWTSFHNGDNLIFRAEDFKRPGNTPVWTQLKQNPDSEVQKLTAALEQSCRGQIEDVPYLEIVCQPSGAALTSLLVE